MNLNFDKQQFVPNNGVTALMPALKEAGVKEVQLVLNRVGDKAPFAIVWNAAGKSATLPMSRRLAGRNDVQLEDLYIFTTDDGVGIVTDAQSHVFQL